MNSNIGMRAQFGLRALAHTPPAVLERLKSAVRAARLESDYHAALVKIEMTTEIIGAECFSGMMKEDTRRLDPLVRSLGRDSSTARRYRTLPPDEFFGNIPKAEATNEVSI